jgi:hypothetical protein
MTVVKEWKEDDWDLGRTFPFTRYFQFFYRLYDDHFNYYLYDTAKPCLGRQPNLFPENGQSITERGPI